MSSTDPTSLFDYATGTSVQNSNYWDGVQNQNIGAVTTSTSGDIFQYTNDQPWINTPTNIPTGTVITSGTTGELYWTSAPAYPSSILPEQILQGLIALGLYEKDANGFIRAVPAIPVPKETKPVAKPPFLYIDEEELYLEVERFD